MECKELNARFHKNQKYNEIKSHHYIISFAPKDREESGLRLVTDLQRCLKAQQSKAYAGKVKLTNLQTMAKTLSYMQEREDIS